MLSPPDRLLPREYAAVIVLAGFLLGIFAVSFFNQQPPTSISTTEETIRVLVRGAVAKPGTYQVIKKGSIPALITLAEPLPTAYLSNELKLIPNPVGEYTLSIPKEDSLEIHLSGALTLPGWYTLPKNSRICDIPNHTVLQPDADTKFLKRRRLLRNGEYLSVPFSKTKLR